MQSFGGIPSMATNMFSAYASMAASVMLFRSIAKDMLPEPVKSFLFSIFGRFFKYFLGRFFNNIPNRMTMVVDEQTGFTRNQIYDAAEVYLCTKINLDSERLKVNKFPKQKSITLSMEKGQEVVDWYKDSLELKWKFHLVEPDAKGNRNKADKRHFELTFDKQNREAVLNEYLPFVLAKAKEIKENERGIKLFTRDCPFKDNDDGGKSVGGRGGSWGCINLDHPITFDKLAMDLKLKRSIIEDLDRFVRRKDYYKKVGKAWKRGYLLYGPPGTGKSSLVAAMANHLGFDVYDLQLSSVHSDSDLRRILFCTTNKSILVVEDIDCSVPTHERSVTKEIPKNNTRLTLSGLLNFIDGLWSSCGDERIIVFTTNHKEKLDPALLRPGRMDVHIHMGYCTPEGFDILAFNYFGLHDHPGFFPEIKELIRQVEITPAELAEHLMRSEDSELALQGVIDLLKQKKEKQDQKEMEEQDKEMRRSKSEKNNRNGDEHVKSPKSNRKKSGKFGKMAYRVTGIKKFKTQS